MRVPWPTGLDVGMLMYCAGADATYQPFLAPMQLCHHFAAPMVVRGRGGIVLVSSGAGLAGGPNMVAYGASKAFDMVMAEALWAELHDKGVDVLALVLGTTDTPALRRLARRGIFASANDPAPIPGAATPTEVVAEVLANLSNGPTWFAGEQVRQGAEQLRALSRSDAVKMLVQHAGGVMDNTRDAELMS